MFTKTFLANGGTHIQYNITDTEELKEAKVKPQEHRDLIVRIGGFSAYFVQLSPEIQNDVISRSEQML
jgi:formate C-acetyltransferase